MFMMIYFLANMVHGPWDDWMLLFAIVAIADGLISLIELGQRLFQSFLFWLGLWAQSQ